MNVYQLEKELKIQEYLERILKSVFYQLFRVSQYAFSNYLRKFIFNTKTSTNLIHKINILRNIN